MELRPLRELSREDLDSWQSLADEALEPNPFFEPGFVLPAARALDQRHRVHLARVVDDARVVAAVPVVTHLWRGVLPARSSWRHKHCFLGTPLVRAGGDPAEVLGALLLGLSTNASQRALVWEQLVHDGPVARALRQAADEIGWQSSLDVRSERAFVSRRSDETYLDHVSAKHRKELRRQRRRLAEAVGGDLHVRDATAAPAAADRFMRVEAGGWKGDEGTAFGSDPADTAMFREICDNFRDRGQLQMLELTGGGRVAAVKCNLLAGPGAFMFKIGYDESLARFSPGVQLELENVSEFHRRELAWMDSCAVSDNQMINGLWPQRRSLTSLVLTRRGTAGSGAAAVLRTAFHLRQRRRGTSS